MLQEKVNRFRILLNTMLTNYITSRFAMSVSTICCKHPEVKDCEFCLRPKSVYFNWYRDKIKPNKTWISTGLTYFLPINSDFFFFFLGLTRGIYLDEKKKLGFFAMSLPWTWHIQPYVRSRTQGTKASRWAFSDNMEFEVLRTRCSLKNWTATCQGQRVTFS